MIADAEFSGVPAQILECLNNLVCTPVGSCGRNRDFGLDWSFLDLPTESAKAAYSAELIEKIERFLPSVQVKQITWQSDGNALKPKVVLYYNG